MSHRSFRVNPLAAATSALPAGALATLLLVQPTLAQSARALDDDGRPPVIFYDYVENGVLRGGVVPVDPTNPLLSNDPGESRVSRSNWVTVVDNGPPANRVDIVVVGDGYTAAELGDYAAHVDTIVPAFFSEPPLDAYASYFNVHRVDVVSNESGVDNDPTQGVRRDTALDMEYWCSNTERLLCVHTGKANNQAANAPEKDQILAIANSTKYGGAGYSNLATLAGENGSTIELALHEFGHSFPNLLDEYDYGGPSNWNGGEPNKWNSTTFDEATMLAQQHKWYRWLDLPHISVFEGSNYSRFGIYRPTNNSKMRNLGRPFEEVNAERFIREIYREVSPIDAASPPGVYTLDDTLSVTPMQPVFHSLDVQWSVGGLAIPGATETTFSPGDFRIPPGIHTVTATVVDNTPMMRNEINRVNVMTATRTWTLLGVRRAPTPPGFRTR